MFNHTVRIGVTGPYCTANIGDWAMLLNNILDLNRFGDRGGKRIEFYVFTYSSAFPHPMIKNYGNHLPISMIEVELTEEKIEISQATPLDCALHIKNYDYIKTIISDLNVMMVSGGGWINDKWCGRISHFYRVMAPLLIAKQLEVPIRFMAQGIGPIIETKEMMRLFFNYLGMDYSIPVRDQFCSPVYLKEILPNSNIVFLPDDLCFINEELLKRKAVLPLKKPYICFVIDDYLDNIKENTELFSAFCIFMKKQYGVNAVFLSFDLAWHGEEQSLMLYNSIQGSEIVNIGKERSFLPVEEAYSCIENAELLITERHHASVISLQTHTPFMLKLDTGNDCYAYNKAHGVLAQYLDGIQHDERFFFSNSWERLFNNLLNNYTEIINMQLDIYNKILFTQNVNRLKEERYRYINGILDLI